MNSRDALRCARMRLEGQLLESCSLDVANDGATPREVAFLLGTGIAQLRREKRDARKLMVWELSEFQPWRDPSCWG